MLAIRKTLALGLALVLLAAGFLAAAPVIGAKAEEGSEKWLVDDAEAVIVFNFKALFKSELLNKGAIAEKFKKGLESDEKAKAFIAATGLDPIKDLDSIIISASTIADKEKAKGRVVFKGNFDIEKLSAAMEKNDNVTTSKEGKIKLFEIKAQDKTLYGAFSGKSTFVLTQEKDETVGLAKDGATKAPKFNKEMQAALKAFTGKESFALVVAVTDELKKMAEVNPQLAKAVKNVNSLTMSATITDSVELNIVGNTSDGKTAGSIAKQLTGLHALGGAAIGAMENIPQEAKDLFEAIKIDNTRDKVTISLKVTKEQIEKAAKKEKEEKKD